MSSRGQAACAALLALLGAAAVLGACGSGAPHAVGASSTTTPAPGAATTTTLAATATTTTAASPTVTIGRWTGRQPAAIYFSGDAGDVATGLTWSAWNTSTAVGHGTRSELSCVPSCAQGTATPYPVTITLSRPVDGRFTLITEQTADAHGTTETFRAPDLGQGACSTSSESSCAFS